MLQLDLGDEIQIEVLFKGQKYILREPTVQELENVKSSDDAAINITDFLNQLGMPSEVVKGMGVSKAKALVDGLMDLVTKKK